MAGAGRKIFTAGDVLTAAEVQDYLQDQTVMVFGGTAARSSAIPTPTEGMFSVTTDNDQLSYYNGTSWEATGGSTLISTTTLSGSSVVLSSIPQIYRDLKVVIKNFQPATDSTFIALRFNGDANTRYAATEGLNAAFSNSSIIVTQTQDNTTSTGKTSFVIEDYASASGWNFLTNGYTFGNNASFPTTMNSSWGFAGAYNQTVAITSITLLLSSGNFTSGQVLLYGVS
jgi:hypothetical protein